MHARVSTFQGPPEQMDEAARVSREEIIPQARQIQGFKGVISLLDRQSGKSLAITLWESEEAMRASEEQANRLRSQGADAGGEQIVSVERFEVDVFETEG